MHNDLLKPLYEHKESFLLFIILNACTTYAYIKFFLEKFIFAFTYVYNSEALLLSPEICLFLKLYFIT